MNDYRTNTINLKVTSGEKQRMLILAARKGLNLSNLIRSAVLELEKGK